jgi:poly-beta-1,6-N-acetyl-D-glucosamine biosynthesis protein PgaD
MQLRDIVLTALLWAFYIYLIRWAMWLALDAAGLGESLGELLPPLQSGALPRWTILDTLLLYGAIATFNAAIMIAWSLYNRARFHGRDRRKFVPTVTPADLARLYAVPTQAVERWQNLRHLVVHHDADGNLTYVHRTEEGYFQRQADLAVPQIQRPKTVFPVAGDTDAYRHAAAVATAADSAPKSLPIRTGQRAFAERSAVRRSPRLRRAARSRRRAR